jgi:antitoxin VapB
MITAKLFKSGGSQAVRLPKEFRFEGSEVIIEKKNGVVVLRPRAATLGDVVRELQEKFPHAGKFPKIKRPKKHERPTLEW